MKKNQNNAAKEYLRSALSDTEKRLLHNPSKGERALFAGAVLLSFVSFVMSAIAAIATKDAMTIARAFTENIIFFVMVVALTVGDKFLVYKKKCFVPVIYSLLWLARDGFAFVGARGAYIALAAAGLIAGVVLYGVLILDQFNSSDHSFKYWGVYGGAAYKIIYSLVAMIVQGSTASAEGNVINVLAIIFAGAADVFVLLMLVYQFDGFSFAKYLFSRIVDGEDEDEYYEEPAKVSAPSAPAKTEPAVQAEEEIFDEEDAEYQPFEEEDAEYQPFEEEEESEDNDYPEYENDDILDDAGYVPYDESADEKQDDAGVRKVGAAEATPEQLGEAQSEPEFSDDDDVLIDDSVIELERARQSNVESIVEAPAEAETETEEAAETENEPLAELKLTPTEIKYVKFAAAHHKPEETLWVEGLAGDLFDVWVDGETICFLNDIDQATGGRGVRSAAIAFEDVEGIGYGKVGDGDCIVLTYKQNGVIRDIGFTKSSFINFKRVMTEIK